MPPISEADVLAHHALVVSSAYYNKRRRLRVSIPASEITYWTVHESQQEKSSHRRRCSKVETQDEPMEPGLSLEDEILEQLDEQARRRIATARRSKRKHSPSPGMETPRAKLPPPPSSVLPSSPSPSSLPPSPPPHHRTSTTPTKQSRPSPQLVVPQSEKDIDDRSLRPTWSFSTPAPLPHLHRQHQLRPSASRKGSSMSDADMSEVDELATPGAGEDKPADVTGEGEEASMAADRTPTRGQRNEATRLLSLPQRLWSSIRPGISLTSSSTKN